MPRRRQRQVGPHGGRVAEKTGRIGQRRAAASRCRAGHIGQGFSLSTQGITQGSLVAPNAPKRATRCTVGAAERWKAARPNAQCRRDRTQRAVAAREAGRRQPAPHSRGRTAPVEHGDGRAREGPCSCGMLARLPHDLERTHAAVARSSAAPWQPPNVSRRSSRNRRPAVSRHGSATAAQAGWHAARGPARSPSRHRRRHRPAPATRRGRASRRRNSPR